MSNLIKRPARPALLLFAALLIAGLAQADGHDEGRNPDPGVGTEVEGEPGWDQAAVTKIADELVMTLRGAIEVSKKAPAQRTAFQQRERDAALASIRGAAEASEGYAKRIRAGWDRDDSEVYFRAVTEEVNDMWETAGDAVPSDHAAPLLERLRDLMDELTALYEMP